MNMREPDTEIHFSVNAKVRTRISIKKQNEMATNYHNKLPTEKAQTANKNARIYDKLRRRARKLMRTTKTQNKLRKLEQITTKEERTPYLIWKNEQQKIDKLLTRKINLRKFDQRNELTQETIKA